MTQPIRLSKRLIEQLGCSRREAELYIEGGWVTVDGEMVDKPQFMVLQQKVELLPGASATPIDPVTLLFHQPAIIENGTELQRLLTPQNWWHEDSSGIRRLNGHFVRLRHNPILQSGASGLAVFTQDWQVIRRLTEDIGKLEQEYIVEFGSEISANTLESLKRADSSKGPWQKPCKVSRQNETRLRFVINNPAPGAIKRLCDNAGLEVISMKCIRIGGVSMGKLPTGQWRYLTANERF